MNLMLAVLSLPASLCALHQGRQDLLDAHAPKVDPPAKETKNGSPTCVVLYARPIGAGVEFSPRRGRP